MRKNKWVTLALISFVSVFIFTVYVKNIDSKAGGNKNKIEDTTGNIVNTSQDNLGIDNVSNTLLGNSDDIQTFASTNEVVIEEGDSQNFFNPIGSAKVTIKEDGTWDMISFNDWAMYQTGAVTLNSTVDMTKNFEFSWNFQFTPAPGVPIADGISFVLHPLYKPGQTIIDSKTGSRYVLPSIFGRHSNQSVVTSANDPDNRQGIQSVGLAGSSLGISDLMNAVAFKVDTYYNGGVRVNYVPNTPYGTPGRTPETVLETDDFYQDLGNGDRCFGAFVNTDNNGYAGKPQYSAPLNGLPITPKSDANGSVSGTPQVAVDGNWHSMKISYESSSYTLSVKVGSVLWKKKLNEREKAVLADRNNWGFEILGTTGRYFESHKIKNIKGFFTPGDPIITTRYIDENGNSLTSSKSVTIEDWQEAHPGSNQFEDSNSPEVIQTNGKTYRRAQVNETIYNNRSRSSRRLKMSGSGGKITISGNNLIVFEEFQNVTFVNYVYRQEIPVNNPYIKSDLQLSTDGTVYSKEVNIHPGDEVTFNYTVKNSTLPVWSKVTAVQSLGGLFTPATPLPNGVTQVGGLLYIPLKSGLTNDLRLGEIGGNEIKMRYQGVEKARITSNDAGQITITNNPVVPGIPPKNTTVTKVSIYDQSSQLIDDNGNHVYGSYFYDSTNSNAPLADTETTFNTANYVPTTDSVKVNDEGWWAFNGTTKVLTIYPHELDYSKDKVLHSSRPNSYNFPWFENYASQIEKTVIRQGVTAKGSLETLFYDQERMTAIEGLKDLNTSEVTNMSGMFDSCSSLRSFDIKNFDTHNVTNMSEMFKRCESVTNFEVRDFNTSKVASMKGMFMGCGSATSIDVTRFNTSNVTDMSLMFNGCSLLSSLDVRNFDTRKVTNIQEMFRDCKVLTSLDLSSFDLNSVVHDGDILNVKSGYNDMFKDTPVLWKLTLGPNTKFPDVTVNSRLLSVNLTNPTPGSKVIDPDKPVPPNPQYYAAKAQWREASADSFLHEPDGAIKTASDIISDSATNNRKRTYVWDQIGQQTLEVTSAGIDFGTHLGYLKNHEYVSSAQNLKLTDNRNVRGGKKWQITAEVSSPFHHIIDSTKVIVGDPLYYHDTSLGMTKHLTSTAQVLYTGTSTNNYQDVRNYPWNLSFKGRSIDIQKAGKYKAKVTFTLVNSTP